MFEQLSRKGKAFRLEVMQNKRPQRQRALSEATGQRTRPKGVRAERVQRGGRGWGSGARRRRGREGEGDGYCTTLFQRLIRPVPTVSLSITHFPAVHALATLTLKSAGPLTC